ncbi:FxsB family cyclophane-forming radical SAM/SPASM peptide maturase [Dactylosporangium sp. NPDC005555]|uniref:FxsB family cyclophane-forming radical SAM/SPASM peptide maturase n=1 Tax=Dactylosporangium sp. NPDC005555 TaxID=3154889 RepID=UPI0033A5DE0E
MSEFRWPYVGLNRDRLEADGWRATPFSQFVLKVAQRCNLACQYCFVYTKADQSWRTRPPHMPEPVLRTALDRIAEHVETHALEHVTVILHGGEPMLLGAHRLRDIARAVRAALPASCTSTVSVQTNGVLLDEAALDVLSTAGVRIGVSVDGDEQTHNGRRPFHHGGGSHAATTRALRLLAEPKYRAMFAGVLCTVDPKSDPLSCYDALRATGATTIDLLLPHATWDDPPAGRAGAAFGQWLARIFDAWYEQPGDVRVRLLDDIILQILGGAGSSEQVGVSPVAVVVVESDGAIEQVDSLKAAYSGAADTGLHVDHDPFDAALRHPGVLARQIGLRALSRQCRSCAVVDACGGGHYVHRYSADAGFANPSVYCEDLLHLITHIKARVTADLDAATAP